MSMTTVGCIPNEEIPVLLAVFNRPDKTRAVVENLRRIRSKRLFVAADGPRSGYPQDREKCRLARQEALAVDWPCEVATRFLDDNVGCDPAVSSAISWFFEQVEFGVVLEDDCLVHPDFFTLCSELFVRYADDERIMQISSLSPYAPREHPYDYHFSRIFRCSGGWGTWRRAWQHYTDDLTRYGNEEAQAILKACNFDYEKSLWQYQRLLEFKGGRVYYWNHWDFQWNLACQAQNGLNIVPEKNLMANIGFGEDSTHTVVMNPVFDDLQVQQLQFPLRHPQFVHADTRPEKSLEKKIYRSLSIKSRCGYLLRRFFGAIAYLREVMPYG